MRKIVFHLLCFLSIIKTVRALHFMDNVRHGYIDNAVLKIHYVTLGEGLVVLILHGFPNFCKLDGTRWKHWPASTR